MPLEPAIQGAARQAEGFGRLAHIAAGTRQRFLNEDALHFFEAQALERRGAVPSPPPAGTPRPPPRFWPPPPRTPAPPLGWCAPPPFPAPGCRTTPPTAPGAEAGRLCRCRPES